MTTIEFLRLFAPSGFIELRTLEPAPEQGFFDLTAPGAGDAVAKWCGDRITRNLYFGVAARKTTNNGTAANCSLLAALFCEFDFSKHSDAAEREAKARAKLAERPPSILNNSGGGLHAYWLLDTPMPLPNEAARATALLRRLITYLGGDLAAKDVARILRVPDTLNWKYDPPRQVTTEVFEPTRRYTLDTLDEWLPQEIAPTPVTTITRPTLSLDRAERAFKILAAAWPEPESGQRHVFALNMAGWCARHGVPEDDMVTILRAAASQAGDTELSDRERAIRDTYKKAASGQSVTGLPSALAVVPELGAVVDELQDALDIPADTPRITVSDNEPPPVATVPVVPELPARALIGLAGEWAKLYTGPTGYHAPPAMYYLAFLTHLGARAARRVRLEDKATEPRLYTALVGPSGIGKGEAIKHGQRDFAEAEHPLVFAVLTGAGSGEGLLEAIEEAPERHLLFQPDELAHVASKIKIEGQSLMSVLLSGFDANPMGNRTKGQTARVAEGGRLSLLTSCTDIAFPELFSSTRSADLGLPHRMLCVTGPKSLDPKDDPTINRWERNACVGRIRRLLEMVRTFSPGLPLPIVRTPAAKARYREWYRDVWHPQSGDPILNRLPTYGDRLTMLVALSAAPVDAPTELTVTVPMIDAVIDLLTWQIDCKRLFAPVVADTMTATVGSRILRAYGRAGATGLTLREAQQISNAHRAGIELWARVHQALVKNGNLKILPGAGKATKHYLAFAE